MSGGGGKGKQKTTQKMDPQALAMIKELQSFGKEVAKMPYMPWTGNDVAAMTPQQVGGMQAFADMGNSFGMGMPTNVMEGMPQATTDASGVSGYSSYPAFKEASAKAAIDNPESAKRYADFYDMSPFSLFGAGSDVAPTSGSSSGTPGKKGPEQLMTGMMGGKSGSGAGGSKGPASIFGGMK